MASCRELQCLRQILSLPPLIRLILPVFSHPPRRGRGAAPRHAMAEMDARGPDGGIVRGGQARQRRRRAVDLHELGGSSKAQSVGWITRPAGPGARGASYGRVWASGDSPELQVLLVLWSSAQAQLRKYWLNAHRQQRAVVAGAPAPSRTTCPSAPLASIAAIAGRGRRDC